VSTSPQGAFADVAREGGRGGLVTLLAGPGTPGAKLFVAADGSTQGTLGDPVIDEAAARHADELMWIERSERRDEGEAVLFIDVTFPPPRLFVFGAVDFAAALCTMARAAGWVPFVVDPRARFAQPARFPDAEEVVASWPEEAFHRLGGIDRATAIAVLTHDPKLDDAALIIALRSNAAYIGAMGSRRAQADRRERLLAKGVTDEEMERISAPIGLDLGSLTAQETALSIMAEIVAMRHGRTGGRLAHAKGRIHEVVG
jgi:xanthine dehydrogenase accessory factor